MALLSAPEIELLYSGDEMINKSEFETLSLSVEIFFGNSQDVFLPLLKIGIFDKSKNSVWTELDSKVFKARVNSFRFHEFFLRLPHIPIAFKGLLLIIAMHHLLSRSVLP